MKLFYFFLAAIILQRVAELIIAKKNEKWMKSKGALEFGTGHYPWMVLMHASFFIVFFFETTLRERGISTYWPILFTIFLVVQAGRIWALSSLGKYWNTKIIVLPHAEIVKKGPYKWLKHPNYLIVAIELIVIPFLFNAYITAIVFTILNIFMLSVRIPSEEKALRELTEYELKFSKM